LLSWGNKILPKIYIIVVNYFIFIVALGGSKDPKEDGPEISKQSA
jgi:hypothetical protein